MSVAVILDPYRPYALMLMEELYRRHGIQSICLHSDWRTRVVLEGRLPFLRSKAVAAHHMISGRSMEHVAEALRPYEVLGVLPTKRACSARLHAWHNYWVFPGHSPKSYRLSGTNTRSNASYATGTHEFGSTRFARWPRRKTSCNSPKRTASPGSS